MDLFEDGIATKAPPAPNTPLAARMRPRTLEEFVGQTHIVGDDTLYALCRRYRIRELALFGSAVRGELRDDSDLDFLVEFDPLARTGFLTLAALTRELSEMLQRPIDVVPKGGLKAAIREQVLAEAEVIFAA